ncbi:helix-turn-helix domain-containing protein [Pseudofrankia inefficax]|uniref:Helix-turn-helix domain protein n=1 Tax=Pseudofrankia inefficax (strain DSM 45817 / CECT 9037 / DDB 130130 / EuI1c) TaxID=298654 RepID=E3JCM8_PSEI1|nr:helix-turn-helix transcriptional regulator [Pseudofrankia inefficax]ADP78724.1 helix-turn-helix domain protein [Pseudofrankia inefficax]
MPEYSPDPAVQRRRLRSELRKAREAAGKTQKAVAEEMDWSPSKLIRIETGLVNISTNDLRALLQSYDVSADRIPGLIETAKAAREQTPWNAYRGVASPELIAFLGYESSASIIRYFEPVLVPGLLQTEEYARVVISTILEQPPESQDVNDLVELRVDRQERVLHGGSPPECHFLLDEPVILRAVGGKDVMRRQLRHLREQMEQSNITVRVVPLSYGLYEHVRVPYTLLEFPDPADEDVLYLEDAVDELIVRENSLDETTKITPITPAHYLQHFWEFEQEIDKASAPAAIERAIALFE